MPDSIIVKQFELKEKAALLSFLKIGFADNPRQFNEEFWNWHFPESPHVEPDNQPIWIAKDGENIVGQLAAIPVELKVGAEQKRAIWILDLIVREDYRGRKLGSKLALAAKDFCPLVLGINTAKQHSTALLEKQGWKMIAGIPRYSKLLFPGEAVPELAKIKLLRKFANSVFAPFRPNFKTTNKNSKIKFVQNFDESFDRLWEEASVQWNCAVIRSSAMLNWQYRAQPGKKFKVIGFYENEKLLGYAVLFFRKPDSNGAIRKAALTDICYHPENSVEIVDQLLRAALKLAVEQRAGTMVTDIIDPLVQEQLEKFGFWKTKNPLQFLVRTNEHQNLLFNPQNWFLTRGDSDTSIFEHPNL